MSQAPTTSTDSAPGQIGDARRSWLARRGLLLESGPQRELALAGFVNQLGTAAFLATVPLYAHQVIHLSIGQVGLCLAGSLELRFRLAPAHAQGQYSGVFGMGMGLCYTSHRACWACSA
ncbi:hypothetical protein [Streptomyces sp. NPDC059468]|uniref:hypothetical protein n=1 Tax=unclassified Streptomyces TaxID=2593676 RepID=UPI0036CEBAFE